jgi:aldehyde:ferredoxin oxidoreductase
MMGDLQNHFGTDASLTPEDNQRILKYLVDNSAEKFRNYKRSQRINDSIAKNKTPIAITKTPYFVKKHRDIAKKLITQKEVSSISNCMACHTTADKGLYSERDINIPNYGKWDDD